MEITAEQYQARTDAINAEAAGFQAQAAAIRDQAAAMREIADTEPDAFIWRRYVCAILQSSPLITAAVARDRANDMLKADQARWPR